MTLARAAGLAVIGAILAVATMPGGAAHPPAASITRKVRIALETNFGDALADEYARRMPDVQIERVTPVGSVATVAAIQHGDADVGFALADVAFFGYLHESHEPSGSRLRGLAALELVPMHLLVRAGILAKTVGDLAGYRVGVGTALSGQTQLADLIFRAYGLGPKIVQPGPRTDLLAGVDATFAFAYYPAATVTNAAADGARLIPIDGPVAAQLRREYPFVRGVTIPAGTYPGQTEDVTTLGVDRLLVASSSLDETLAHELTRVFVEALPALSSALHTSMRLTNLEQASATSVPLHMGAARYYRERELMR